MKKETYVHIISILLILLFVYTCTSKIINFDSVVRNLHKQPLPQLFVPFIAISFPAAELIIALLLIFPQTQKFGLYASLVLMTTFTIYVSYILFILPPKNIPCACGGFINQFSWTQHLIFDLFFTLSTLSALMVNKYCLSTESKYQQISNIA